MRHICYCDIEKCLRDLPPPPRFQNIRWFSNDINGFTNADSGPVAGFYNRVGGLQLSRKRVRKPISASQSRLAGARTAASIFRSIQARHKTRRRLYGRLNVR
jgi:hypothetical protein